MKVVPKPDVFRNLKPYLIKYKVNIYLSGENKSPKLLEPEDLVGSLSSEISSGNLPEMFADYNLAFLSLLGHSEVTVS